jgi:DNA polymerase III epsilon subunit-like protein
MIVLIYDTETTGLPLIKTINKDTLDKWPHIVQLSYILYDTNEHKILGTYDWIIKLPITVKMDTGNIKIHGITNEMSHSQGIDIKNVLMQFTNDCRGADLIVAHNASFDLQMIQVEIERLHYTNNTDVKYSDFYSSINKKIYCTMQETVDLCNLIRINKMGNQYIKYPQLSELHEKLFSTVPSNLHNSFNDVIVCLRCFYKLQFDKDILELDSEIRAFALPLNIC